MRLTGQAVLFDAVLAVLGGAIVGDARRPRRCQVRLAAHMHSFLKAYRTPCFQRDLLPQAPHPPAGAKRRRPRPGAPLSPAATALAMLPGGELAEVGLSVSQVQWSVLSVSHC